MSRVVELGLEAPLGPGRVVVVSPHLDDAVLSLGGAIAAATARGREVVVVTVLAGDPASVAPAGGWDRSGGFATEGEATAARREEDARACALVGATPVWLPFADSQYEPRPDPAAVAAALAPWLEDAAAVLVPGHPLTHPDHRFVAAVLDDLIAGARVLAYAEQPYAGRLGSGGAPSVGGWARLRTGSAARMRKARAVASYRSQLPMLGLSQRLYLGLARIALPRTRIGAERLRECSDGDRERGLPGPPRR